MPSFPKYGKPKSSYECRDRYSLTALVNDLESMIASEYHIMQENRIARDSWSARITADGGSLNEYTIPHHPDFWRYDMARRGAIGARSDLQELLCLRASGQDRTPWWASWRFYDRKQQEKKEAADAKEQTRTS